MNTLDALNEYLRKVERALGLLALSRGAAQWPGWHWLQPLRSR